MKWDAFDLFDGRLYLEVSAAVCDGTAWPPQVAEELDRMAQLLSAVSGVRVDVYAWCRLCVDMAGTAVTANNDTGPHEPTPPVLPFSHPVMDSHLVGVRLRSDDVPAQSSASGKIFQELTHWHNSKVPVDPKYVPKAKGYYAARRHQKFMSDTIAYSASLTGASGKNIVPESIVVQHPPAKLKMTTRDKGQGTGAEDQKGTRKDHQTKGSRVRRGAPTG